MRQHRRDNTKRRKRGFTLIECIVSIAIFAIMGTMFASFMVSSVRVVNLTLANDRDREALLEAISAAGSASHETANGTVTVETVNTKGEKLSLNINLYSKPVVLEDKFVRYTAPNGTVYNIYLGANAIAMKYLSIQNEADNANLLGAINAKTDIEIQVTYRNEIDKFKFTVECSKIGGTVTCDIENDAEGNPYYVRYYAPNGDKYLIYMWRNTSTDKKTDTNTQNTAPTP